jgi:endonuclease/exonuclease/phosphatase family metal-dependent hydrolase
MKRNLLLLFLILISVSINSQNTLKLMHYNLLYYGANYDDCDETTNNVADKEQYLRTIVNYYKPDILLCNEIGKTPGVVDRLLDSVFNYNGTQDYARAEVSNVSNSISLISMVYYNKNKVGLASQHGVETDFRDFAFHKMYFKDSDLAITGDTAFFYCISTHLKAGNTPQDVASRKSMVDSLMKYMSTLSTPGNYILAGDFNFYTSNEPGYQALINHNNVNIRFYDPINQPGDWHYNSAFSLYHTQSTRTSSNGCPTTGGMDDRFDFILVSSPLLNGPHHNVKYVPNSYKTPGQDGQRFGKSLINPANYTAPADIINAMYELSDHLPVIMDIQRLYVGVDEISKNEGLEIHIQNPAINNEIKMQIYSTLNSKAIIQIFGITGNKLYEEKIDLINGYNHHNLSVNNLSKGVYLLNLSSDNLYSNTVRLVIP